MAISVAMCTYNGSRFILEQLESICQQTTLPKEVIICDDGSSDDTPRIIEEVSRSAPFEIIYIQNKTNLGSTKNFEKAIRLCRFDYIALSDQDDIWYPNKLSCLSEVLDRDFTIGGVFSDGDVMDDNSRLIHKRLWERVDHYRGPDEKRVEKDLITGATLMFRATLRDVLLPIKGPFLHDGWISWMLVLYSTLLPLPLPLIKYRVHGAQQIGLPPVALRAQLDLARETRRAQYLWLAEHFEILREHWLKNPGPNHGEWLKRFEQKIEHLHLRANLPKSHIARWPYVASGAYAYFKYSRGIKSICKDLFI